MLDFRITYCKSVFSYLFEAILSLIFDIPFSEQPSKSMKSLYSFLPNTLLNTSPSVNTHHMNSLRDVRTSACFSSIHNAKLQWWLTSCNVIPLPKYVYRIVQSHDWYTTSRISISQRQAETTDKHPSIHLEQAATTNEESHLNTQFTLTSHSS